MKKFLALLGAIVVFAGVMFVYADTPHMMENAEAAFEEAELTLTLSPMPAISSPLLQYMGDEEASLYSSIVSHFYTMDEEFEILGDYDAIKDAALAASKSPEIFWVESVKGRKTENGMELFIGYSMTEEERVAASAQIETIANALVEASDGTVNGLVHTVYAWMSENVAYDHNPDTQRSDARAHVDAAFIDGLAVCSGYSQAVCYAAYHAGYEAAYCVGYVGDIYHAWTVIRDMDGNEVMVDLLNGRGPIVDAEMESMYQADFVRWYKEI